MKRIHQLLSTTCLVAASMFMTAGNSRAVSTIYNGIYAGDGTDTQIIIGQGKISSNTKLNTHQLYSTEVTDFLSENEDFYGIYTVPTFAESTGSSTLTLRMYDLENDGLVATYTSVIRVSTLTNSAETLVTKTDWNASLTLALENTDYYDEDEDLTGEDILRYVLGETLDSFTERYEFESVGLTCGYTIDGQERIVLRRVGTGTGAGQGSPLIPNNANWSITVILGFPIVSANSVIWCDPPFAGSFEYSVAAGRSERVSTVSLPKGFGKKIQVLAQPADSKSLKLVGTFNSGAKIDLLKKQGFSKGAKKVVIRNIKPKVDLKKKTPYPVGLTFTALSDYSASLKIKSKDISNKR